METWFDWLSRTRKMSMYEPGADIAGEILLAGGSRGGAYDVSVSEFRGHGS